MSIKTNGKTISVTTPFDAAVVDLVTGLNKQKQVLAQALNDKGVNVTSTDTLDKMAAEIKDLDVVGSQDKVVCEFYNQLNATSNSLSERISSAQARVLREHNAIISRTSAGVFGIYKLAVDGNLIQIATCDCNDFVPAPSTSDFHCRFGFSKNEEYIAWYDSPKKNLILFHMDWETNTLTRTLAYTVTTSRAGTYGSYYEENSSSNNCLIGIAPASDGSKVCILSNNNNTYIHATVVDVATQTEVTNIGTTANAVKNTDKICWGFWHWDIETGIIKGGTSYYPLFEMTLDLSGDIPFMSFGGYRITRMGNYPDTCYGMPYFLWDKGLMLQLGVSSAATGYTNVPSNIYGTLWLRDIETGELLDSAEIEIDRMLILDKSNTSYNRKVGISTAKSCLHSPVVVKKDGKILVGFGMYMRFELDEENKKLIPYKHNGAKDDNGRYVCFPIYNSSNDSMTDSYVNGDYIYCEENPDLIFSRTGSREAYGGNWSTIETCFVFCREEPCVLGLFLNRNGKSRLMYDKFSYTQYKAGAYAEKDEVAIVDVES